MGRIVDILVRDLDHLLRISGSGGGCLGPSVYDTAMVVRLAPPPEGARPALNWLLEQQHPDGGWGPPHFPAGRDLPTLAAILALRELKDDPGGRAACAAGLAFLRNQASRWSTIPDDLPIALELTFPALVNAAITAGVDISDEPYRVLAAVGDQKRKAITRMPLLAGTPAAYAWEALGLPASAATLVDAAGSVGTSPSATAAWMSATRDLGANAPARKAAAAYLRRASVSTGAGVPGVVPHAYPVERFEQAWVLFIVLSAGLFTHPGIAESLDVAVQDLASAVRPDGVGYADVFVPDGDDTFCSVAALKGAGRAVDSALIRGFQGENQFFVFRGERNPSPSANAHALYALALFGEDFAPARKFLVSRQSPDGRFLEDKWHTSWLYTTHRAVLALRVDDGDGALTRTLGAILANQRPDGGFGASSSPTSFETAHGLLALRALRDKGLSSAQTTGAMERAYHWMLAHYRPFGPGENALWIGKELYAAPRIDRAAELSALLTMALEAGE